MNLKQISIPNYRAMRAVGTIALGGVNCTIHLDREQFHLELDPWFWGPIERASDLIWFNYTGFSPSVGCCNG